MDSKEKETKCQKNSGVDYSFPISEYAKQLDLPVRDRYLQKIAAIGIDPVLIEGKDFKLDCLPPVESTDILCYLVLETSFHTQQQFKAFRSFQKAPLQNITLHLVHFCCHSQRSYTKPCSTRRTLPVCLPLRYTNMAA